MNKRIYPDRFDPEYLALLLSELTDIPKLKDGALDIEKTKDLKKCISIDFCGMAASTILCTNLKNEDMTPEVFKLRKDILAAFKNIFDAKLLSDLNGEGYYLRVRFCFSYLYSDYPICLMKAERPEVWMHLGDVPVHDYYVSEPLTFDHFKRSKIFESQQDSLSEIINILEDNKDIIILGGTEKKPNTIQVRFNVIPSPTCTLFINNTVFSDAYLYSKLGKNQHLSLNYPVIVLNENDTEFKKSFDSIRTHWNFLWRHDLSIFCSDATKFDPQNNIDGLKDLLGPDSIIGPDGTNWKHKERRIWEKKEEIAKRKLEKTAADLEEISKWRNNLNLKLELCTRKLKKKEDIPEDEGIHLKIEMKKEFFHFEIFINGKRNYFVEYLQPKNNILFCVLAHYSYAIREGKKPVLHKCYAHPLAILRRRLIEELNNYDLEQSQSGDVIFENIFECILSENHLQLKIPFTNIVFDHNNRVKIEKATYSSYQTQKSATDKKENYIQKSCLEYSL